MLPPVLCGTQTELHSVAALGQVMRLRWVWQLLLLCRPVAGDAFLHFQFTATAIFGTS
jgi:hypothetical protein